MNTPDENGFVKRGFLLLGAMTILVAVVLSIIFVKPEQTAPVDVKSLPAEPSAKGWEVRYNATVALLRRGSDKVSWPVVHEMLDEKQQLKNCQFSLPDGREIPDEAAARRFVIAALKALTEWKKKIGEQPMQAPLASLRDQVNVLAKSAIPELGIQAKDTQLALGQASP